MENVKCCKVPKRYRRARTQRNSYKKKNLHTGRNRTERQRKPKKDGGMTGGTPVEIYLPEKEGEDDE